MAVRRTLAANRLFHLAALACCCAAPAQSREAPGTLADGWITHADAGSRRPVVVLFRREVTLGARPARFPVTVTADNRFVLYVNGRRVASGPSAGDVAHWRVSSLDLAPFLVAGRNIVAAVVWNGVQPPQALPANPTPDQERAAMIANAFGQTAPAFQQSVATGFRLEGKGPAAILSTRNGTWQARIDPSRSFTNGFRQTIPDYYVAGAPEGIDAAKADQGWSSPASAPGWAAAVAAPAAARRTLVADPLPPQRYVSVPAGETVRTDLAEGTAFPARPVTVPANSRVQLLLRRDAMVSAYPALRTGGGRGATIKITYAEALYDRKGKKGDRDEVADRKAKGITDTFVADGRPATFAPLWWRTWRYLQLDVTTGAEPLTLEGLDVAETGYPFKQVGRFRSSDPALDRIWQIGWRTALIDAHETYMDSAYWEQLQYVGDTRLQMLISYAVAGDPRLAEQAIDAFAHSRGTGGLVQGAYPSRDSNVIAPFSLLWIGMLDDWRMHQPDKAVIVRNLPRMREVLAWFDRWRSPNGLLTKNPEWNFVDWAGQSGQDRTVFPSYSREGESCLLSAIHLGALQQAAELERYAGEPARAARDVAAAEATSRAIRARCWASDRQLFADNPDRQVFSQQMNALAILYGVVPQAEAQALLGRIVAPGRGIDAPAGMFQSSYYFAWYLVRAFEKAGRADAYLDLLSTWRDLLKLNYTTWPETRGDTRSDTHAWSAHPTADLLGIVAGIRPATPGYASVRVAPALGTLTALEATAATPKGPVEVRYRLTGATLSATVLCPPGLAGTFEWGGQTRRLRPGRNVITLSSAP